MRTNQGLGKSDKERGETQTKHAYSQTDIPRHTAREREEEEEERERKKREADTKRGNNFE
jgi:hypothetical protein